MRAMLMAALLALAASGTPAAAATIPFHTDPFAGSDAPSTPGRQIVGGEPSLSFDIAADVFEFLGPVFGMGDTVNFANGAIDDLPTGGVNVIVLRTFTPTLGAGAAASLIAGQITSPGAGVFIYFNGNLDLARLVYSADLNSDEADLKILARLTNLNGQAGRDAMALFTEANFSIVEQTAVPEPAALLLVGAGLAGLARRRSRSR